MSSHGFWQKRRLTVFILLNVLAVAAGLALAEGWLRYQEREEGMDAGWLVADPVLGYRLSPTLEGVIAEWGIRTPNFPVEKPAQTYRILVLGDSVAWPDDGFVTLLRDALPPDRYEVINAAIPGYTIYQERRMLETLLAVKPDLVVLQYCVNDHHKFLHEISDNGRWLITQEARDVLEPEDNNILNWLTRNSRLLRRYRVKRISDAIPKGWAGRTDVGPAWLDSGWQYYRQQLEELTVSLGSTPLAIIAIPFRPQLGSDHDQAIYPQEQLAALTKDMAIPLLDLTPEFARIKNGLYTDELHLTGAGHQLVCELTLTFLQQRFPKLKLRPPRN